MKKGNSNAERQTTYYISKSGHTGLAVISSSDAPRSQDETITVDGVEYERADEIHIDVSLIPDYVRDSLAAATLDLMRDIFGKSRIQGNPPKTAGSKEKSLI